MDTAESVTNANSFKEALKGLTGNSSNLPDKIQRFMNENRAGFLGWINAEVSYSGFDAITMRKKVISKIKTEEHLYKLIAAGIIRGDNLTNILKSVKCADLKKILTECKASLRIVDRVGGDVGAVTLSRVLACFPDVSSHILLSDVPMVVPVEVVRSISPHFPGVARHQTTAGLIPESVKGHELIKLLNVYMVPYMLTSRVINQKNKDWVKLNLKTQFETNAKYLLNSYHSKVIEEARKVKLAEDLDIVSVAGIPGANWEFSSHDCKRWLIKEYGMDMSSIIQLDDI